MRANECRPAGAAPEAWRPQTSVPPSADIRARWRRPPDLAFRYPDPVRYLTCERPFGLTLDELRTEWRRQSADWQKWELELRLLPAGVTR